MTNNLDRTKAPEVFNLPFMEMPETRRYKLDNGVDVVILDKGDEEVNRITVVQSGGIAESGKGFIPKMASQIMSEGAGGMSSKEVAEVLDYNGSWLKSVANDHHRSTTLFSLNRNFNEVLPVFADIILNPAFPEHDTAVIAERNARQLELEQEKPSFFSTMEAEKIVMGANHPLTMRYTPDDLRDVTARELRKYYTDNLSADSMTVYLGGRISKEIERDVINTFMRIDKSDKSHGFNIIDFAMTSGVRVAIPHPGAVQNSVAMTLPAIKRDHDDYILLRIAVMALGGYFGSRLMANIREDKGYTYGISAGLLGHTEGGYIKIDCECDSCYTDALINEVESELSRMVSDPLSSEELERLKRYYMSSLVGQLDSPFTILDMKISEQILSMPGDYFKRQQEVLANITSEAIADISRKYLDRDKLSVVVAGNV